MTGKQPCSMERSQRSRYVSRRRVHDQVVKKAGRLKGRMYRIPMIYLSLSYHLVISSLMYMDPVDQQGFFSNTCKYTRRVASLTMAVRCAHCYGVFVGSSFLLADTGRRQHSLRHFVGVVTGCHVHTSGPDLGRIMGDNSSVYKVKDVCNILLHFAFFQIHKASSPIVLCASFSCKSKFVRISHSLI